MFFSWSDMAQNDEILYPEVKPFNSGNCFLNNLLFQNLSSYSISQTFFYTHIFSIHIIAVFYQNTSYINEPSLKII